MTEEKGFIERRVHRRHKAQDGSFAAIKNGSWKLGRVKNISKGGLAFICISGHDHMPETFLVDIFFSGQGFYLKDVPSKKNSDLYESIDSPISSLMLKKIGIEFKELNHYQQEQLDNFIRDCTVKP